MVPALGVKCQAVVSAESTRMAMVIRAAYACGGQRGGRWAAAGRFWGSLFIVHTGAGPISGTHGKFGWRFDQCHVSRIWMNA